MPQTSPEGDHQANGMAESAVRELKRQMRVLRLATEDKLGKRIADDSPILAWLPRYSAAILNNDRVGADGKTAEFRRTGKNWRKPSMQFMEMVHVRKLGEMGQSNYQSRMTSGRLLGFHERSGAVLAMTAEGVIRGKSASKITLQQAWDPEGLESL